MGYKATIDDYSGFCAGVIYAIENTEMRLKAPGSTLYSLGAIVHNNEEMRRLKEKGLQVIDRSQLATLAPGSQLLIRAHGEPPSTYKMAKELNITIIECTCAVVLQLQKRILEEYKRLPKDGLLLIFGKRGHAEVNGLVGQVDGHATIIESVADLDKCDLIGRPLSIFSQTTKNPIEYESICFEIRRRILAQGGDASQLKVHDTICRQVSNRQHKLAAFARQHTLILFVSGKESSNGKVLFRICQEANPRSYAIENKDDINLSWLQPNDSVGICGATSTPKWLMEDIAKYVRNL